MRNDEDDFINLGEIIATYHLGDPYNVTDSWRASRRRDLLYQEKHQRFMSH